MAAGEKFAPLNFKSLTEINGFCARVFAVLVRPQRDLWSPLGDGLEEGHSQTVGEGNAGTEGAHRGTAESTQRV